MAEVYTAQKVVVDSIETIRLTDSAHALEVSICPSVGNIASDFRVHGQPILMSPPALSKWHERPEHAGIPLLAPWAGRLGGDAYWANGKRYLLNGDAVEIHRDLGGLPIHGLLLFASAWETPQLRADDQAAQVTSRLEFWKHPEWMAQFPFAHSIEMTYRLSGGTLEVRTTIENRSTDAMPLAIGFHPWYQIPDVPRDQWELRVPVREHYVLSSQLIPTGEIKPAHWADPTPLAGLQFDDVFSGVDTNREFSLQGNGRKVSLRFGPKFPIAVVYAPHTRDVVCFEPLAGLPDAFNLAHQGLIKNLQSVAPGENWTESFWVHPSGF